MGEFKQIQEILSKIGTEFFKIDEEMAEKNEAEDGSSISLKSPCHMKWDRQQNIPYFTCFLMSQKCKFCFLLYLKEIYAQFVETNVLVKHNIHHELKLTIMDLNLQITRKHPVDILHSTHKIFLFSSKYFYVTKKYDTYL